MQEVGAYHHGFIPTCDRSVRQGREGTHSIPFFYVSTCNKLYLNKYYNANMIVPSKVQYDTVNIDTRVHFTRTSTRALSVDRKIRSMEYNHRGSKYRTPILL